LKIILASGSPRRKQLMELAGIPCEVLVTNVDETIKGPPDKQVRDLALRKAEAAKEMTGGESTIIIAADTLVYVDKKVLNKPESRMEAFSMLRTLSGRKHTVYTGVAIIAEDNCANVHAHTFFDATDVYFRQLSDDDILAYIDTGEPFDKAGAYGVQERGAVLVDRVEGDFYTVVGLPIAKVWGVLKSMGIKIW